MTRKQDNIISGNKIGGRKAAAKNLARDPDFYKKIGSKGAKEWDRLSELGLAKPKGFAAMDREKRVAAGRKGGEISRRTGVKNGQETK